MQTAFLGPISSQFASGSFQKDPLSVGCLIESIKAEALVGTMEAIVQAEDPGAALKPAF